MHQMDSESWRKYVMRDVALLLHIAMPEDGCDSILVVHVAVKATDNATSLRSGNVEMYSVNASLKTAY